MLHRRISIQFHLMMTGIIMVNDYRLSSRAEFAIMAADCRRHQGWAAKAAAEYGLG